MWCTMADTRITWLAKAWSETTMKPAHLIALPMLLAPLAGCISDAASYMVNGDNEHTVTLMRHQNLFWKDTVNLAIVPIRMPECQASMMVDDVPRTAVLNLYWSPDEYVEPIFILDVDGTFYAVSTRSCKVQAFDAAPANPGQTVGRFLERDGHLMFEPETQGQGDQAG